MSDSTLSDSVCAQCGAAQLEDARSAGKEVAAKVDAFIKAQSKRLTKARLGIVGEGAFRHPKFIATWVTSSVCVPVAMHFKWGLGVWAVVLAPLVGGVAAFAYAAHLTQKEIQAEAASARASMKVCGKCGELKHGN